MGMYYINWPGTVGAELSSARQNALDGIKMAAENVVKLIIPMLDKKLALQNKELNKPPVSNGGKDPITAPFYDPGKSIK